MGTIAQALLSSEERAQGVTFTISTTALQLGNLSADDQAKLTEFTSRYGLTTGVLFDMTLSKQVGSNAPVAITDLGENALSFTVAVPSELQATDGSARTFYLLRLHGGEVRALAGTTGNTITGKSDKFSTFVIAYRSGSTSASGNPLTSGSGSTTNVNGTSATTGGTTAGTTTNGTSRAATARTGDNSTSGIIIGLVAIAGILAVVIGLRQRNM
jgi:hypothetical protein